MADFNRRLFLRGMGGLALSSWMPQGGFAASRADLPGAREPKVVLVQYGGSVRPRETVASIAEPHTTLSRFLFHKLLPEGTVLDAMRNEHETGHASGSLYLFSGRYGNYPESFFEKPKYPENPLLPEVARKQLGLSEDEVILVHNEQADTESMWASREEGYGAAYRPGILSLYRARRRIYQRDLAETKALVAAGTIDEKKLEELVRFDKEHRAKCYRTPEEKYLLDSPAIAEYWDRYFEHYEPPGARERADLAPKGYWESLYSLYDRLLPQGDPGWTVMALRALQELKPRFLSVIYRDVDYVHWGLPYLYSRGIQRMDQGLWEISQYLDQDPYYAGTTTLLVVPESGRGTNPRVRLPFQHHSKDDPGSHEIFLYARGPGIAKGRRSDKPCQITDVAPTVAKVLGLDLPWTDGRVLEELFV